MPQLYTKVRISCLLLVFLLASLSAAQSPRQRDRSRDASAGKNPDAEKEAQKEKEARDELAAQLLTRAGGISSQVSDGDRAYLLARLAQASARKNPQQALDWADEAFTVTSGLPASAQRTQTEVITVQAATDADPQRALQLLGRMEAPPSSLPDMRSMAAVQVFQRYWQKNGIDGVDALLAAAHKMGDSGMYPYLAVGMLLRQVKNKDVERAQSLATDAVSFYPRLEHSSESNQQFVMFLRQSQDLISKALMKDTLQQVVKDSVDTAKDATPLTASITDDAGHSASVTNASALTLIQVVSLARNIDPEWAKKLEEQYSQLKDAANLMSSASGAGQRLNIGLNVGKDGKPAPPNAAMQDRVTSMQIDDLPSADIQRKLAMSEQIQDPATRAAVNAGIAGDLAASDPEQSNRLLKQAREALADASDPADKLRILVGLAQAQISMKDVNNFVPTLARAYTMGEQVFRAGVDKSPDAAAFSQPGFDSLSRLTRLAIRFDQTATLAAVDNLGSPLLQAHMLLVAAEGLDPQSRALGAGMRVRIED